MKKQLLALAAVAILAPAVSAQTGLTEKWSYETTDLTALWNGDAPDWKSTDAIKKEPCARVGVGHDGKVYTINMKTMSIAELSASGWKDLYKLPTPEFEDDYYGTAISTDDAGNFLVGHYFNKAPDCSMCWSIYDPLTGACDEFWLPNEIEDAEGLNKVKGVGRIDCVGRVLGDLTKEAVFYISFQYGSNGDSFPACAWNVIEVKISHEAGKVVVEANPLQCYNSSVKNYCTVGVAQSAYASYDEYKGNEYKAAFYSYANGFGGQVNTPAYLNGSFDWGFFGSSLGNYANTNSSGFDTFVIDGKRYFIINHTENKQASNSNPMAIGVFNESYELITWWENTKWSAANGYSSISAETNSDGTANIYVYNSCQAAGESVGRVCAAQLLFNPAEVVIPEKASLLDRVPDATPIEISSVEDLLAARANLVEGADNYFVLTADLDMSEVSDYFCLNGETSKANIFFDGRGHVIKNLSMEPGNASFNPGFIGKLQNGWVKNLGLENVKSEKTWYQVGGVAAIMANAAIDNCFVTGEIIGAASGAIAGSNMTEALISNCFSFANVTENTGASNNFTGGILGRADGPLTIKNCYTIGDVKGDGTAAGIVSIRNSNSVTLENVLVWSSEINGAVAAGAVYVGGNATVESKNVLVADYTQVNGETVKNGASAEQMDETVKTWSAFEFSDEHQYKGFPGLKWQFGLSGINDIVAEETDAEAVYYNLQGVQVTNPQGGIYIVRRGNKVTKELVK